MTTTLIKVPVAKTQPKKVLIPFKGLGFSGTKKKEPKVEKQHFFFNVTDSGIMIKFHNMQFGIRKNGNKFDSHSANVTDKADTQYVALIQSMLRARAKQLNEGENYQTIADEFNAKSGTAETLRIFIKRIEGTKEKEQPAEVAA